MDAQPPKRKDINDSAIEHGSVVLQVAPMVKTYYRELISYLGDDEPTEAEDDAQWLVKGVIARGVPNLFVAGPKSTKTLIAIHIAICIAAGTDWIGFPTTRGRVLFLAHEDPRVEVRRRLWRLARGLGMDPRSLNDRLIVNDRELPFRFDDREDMKRMANTIDLYKPDVVFVDSLSRAHRKEENSVTEMKMVTEAWFELCARGPGAVGPALVMLHHTNKTTDGVRGSGEIYAAARHKVTFAKRKAITKLGTDGNMAYQPEPFSVVIEDTEVLGKKAVTISRTDEDPEAEKETELDADLDARILDVLNGGAKFVNQLAEALKSQANAKGVRRAKLIARLDILKAQGFIHRASPRQPWSLTRRPGA